MFSTLDDPLNLSPNCKRKGFDFIGNIFRKKTRESTFVSGSRCGVSASVPVLTSSDSLDDCLLETRRDDSSDTNQSESIDYNENGGFAAKSPSVRSKSTSPNAGKCVSESVHCSSLVCLASIGALHHKDKRFNWSQCNCSTCRSLALSGDNCIDESDEKMLTSASTVPHDHNHHHHDIDLLKSARSRLTMISNSSDLYNFHPNSPVSFNVRDLKQDMDILTLSRTDNPYIAAKLDLLSETAERSLLVSPCSIVANSNYSTNNVNDSTGNISANVSTASRQSTVQLHPLLQSRMSSSDRKQEAQLSIDDIDDTDALESSELMLINSTDEAAVDDSDAYNYTNVIDSTARVDSVDISLDNLLDDGSNLHEMMIRSPPPQFPTRLSSFIFPENSGSGVSGASPSATTSPVRSLHHTSSPMSGHRSVPGWRSRYPPIEKASSDTSAVLSPRLLAAVAKLASKDTHSNSKAASNTSSASNILTTNMLPLQIRRLTRRASSGTSAFDKVSIKSKFQ